LFAGKKMKDRRKIAITKERDVKTYAEMWQTSRCLFERGLEDEKGSYHQFMASLVFTAFTLEAYLNHIGPKLFDCWINMERFGPREKLKSVLKRLQIHADCGTRPWHIMRQLFGFRNDIAHGKSEVIRTSDKVFLRKHSNKDFGLVQTKWEKYCSRANAKKAREDVEKIIKTIYEAGQFENDYPFICGFQVSGATIVQE
jgi:hypothetical protein